METMFNSRQIIDGFEIEIDRDVACTTPGSERSEIVTSRSACHRFESMKPEERGSTCKDEIREDMLPKTASVSSHVIAGDVVDGDDIIVPAVTVTETKNAQTVTGPENTEFQKFVGNVGSSDIEVVNLQSGERNKNEGVIDTNANPTGYMKKRKLPVTKDVKSQIAENSERGANQNTQTADESVRSAGCMKVTARNEGTSRTCQWDDHSAEPSARPGVREGCASSHGREHANFEEISNIRITTTVSAVNNPVDKDLFWQDASSQGAQPSNQDNMKKKQSWEADGHKTVKCDPVGVGMHTSFSQQSAKESYIDQYRAFVRETSFVAPLKKRRPRPAHQGSRGIRTLREKAVMREQYEKLSESNDINQEQALDLSLPHKKAQGRDAGKEDTVFGNAEHNVVSQKVTQHVECYRAFEPDMPCSSAQCSGFGNGSAAKSELHRFESRSLLFRNLQPLTSSSSIPSDESSKEITRHLFPHQSSATREISNGHNAATDQRYSQSNAEGKSHTIHKPIPVYPQALYRSVGLNYNNSQHTTFSRDFGFTSQRDDIMGSTHASVLPCMANDAYTPWTFLTSTSSNTQWNGPGTEDVYHPVSAQNELVKQPSTSTMQLSSLAQPVYCFSAGLAQDPQNRYSILPFASPLWRPSLNFSAVEPVERYSYLGCDVRPEDQKQFKNKMHSSKHGSDSKLLPRMTVLYDNFKTLQKKTRAALQAVTDTNKSLPAQSTQNFEISVANSTVPEALYPTRSGENEYYKESRTTPSYTKLPTRPRIEREEYYDHLPHTHVDVLNNRSRMHMDTKVRDIHTKDVAPKRLPQKLTPVEASNSNINTNADNVSKSTLDVQQKLNLSEGKEAMLKSQPFMKQAVSQMLYNSKDVEDQEKRTDITSQKLKNPKHIEIISPPAKKRRVSTISADRTFKRLQPVINDGQNVRKRISAFTIPGQRGLRTCVSPSEVCRNLLTSLPTAPTQNATENCHNERWSSQMKKKKNHSQKKDTNLADRSPNKAHHENNISVLGPVTKWAPEPKRWYKCPRSKKEVDRRLFLDKDDYKESQMRTSRRATCMTHCDHHGRYCQNTKDTVDGDSLQVMYKDRPMNLKIESGNTGGTNSSSTEVEASITTALNTERSAASGPKVGDEVSELQTIKKEVSLEENEVAGNFQLANESVNPPEKCLIRQSSPYCQEMLKAFQSLTNDNSKISSTPGMNSLMLNTSSLNDLQKQTSPELVSDGREKKKNDSGRRTTSPSPTKSMQTHTQILDSVLGNDDKRGDPSLMDTKQSMYSTNAFVCRLCKLISPSFSALLHHQGKECLSSEGDSAPIHSTDCLGNLGKYDTSSYRDICQCTPCPMCKGVFSTRFRVYSHLQRGCYRERKIHCGLGAPGVMDPNRNAVLRAFQETTESDGTGIRPCFLEPHQTDDLYVFNSSMKVSEDATISKCLKQDPCYPGERQLELSSCTGSDDFASGDIKCSKSSNTTISVELNPDKFVAPPTNYSPVKDGEIPTPLNFLEDGNNSRLDTQSLEEKNSNIQSENAVRLQNVNLEEISIKCEVESPNAEDVSGTHALVTATCTSTPDSSTAKVVTACGRQPLKIMYKQKDNIGLRLIKEMTGSPGSDSGQMIKHNEIGMESLVKIEAEYQLNSVKQEEENECGTTSKLTVDKKMLSVSLHENDKQPVLSDTHIQPTTHEFHVPQEILSDELKNARENTRNKTTPCTNSTWHRVFEDDRQHETPSTLATCRSPKIRHKSVADVSTRNSRCHASENTTRCPCQILPPTELDNTNKMKEVKMQAHSDMVCSNLIQERNKQEMRMKEMSYYVKSNQTQNAHLHSVDFRSDRFSKLCPVNLMGDPCTMPLSDSQYAKQWSGNLSSGQSDVPLSRFLVSTIRKNADWKTIRKKNRSKRSSRDIQSARNRGESDNISRHVPRREGYKGVFAMTPATVDGKSDKLCTTEKTQDAAERKARMKQNQEQHFQVTENGFHSKTKRRREVITEPDRDIASRTTALNMKASNIAHVSGLRTALVFGESQWKCASGEKERIVYVLDADNKPVMLVEKAMPGDVPSSNFRKSRLLSEADSLQP